MAQAGDRVLQQISDRMAAGETESALSDAAKLVETHPDDPRVLGLAGSAALAAGEAGRAAGYYQAAAKRLRGHPGPLLGLLRAHLTLGADAEAAQVARTLHEAVRRAMPGAIGEIENEIGVSFAEFGRLDAAAGWLRQAAGRAGPAGDAAVNLAAVLYRMAEQAFRIGAGVTAAGYLREGLDQLARVASTGDDGIALMQADMHRLLSEPARAADFYTRALAATPQDAQALAGLALCRQSLGDMTAAREALEAALAIEPGNPLAESNYARLPGEIDREGAIARIRGCLDGGAGARDPDATAHLHFALATHLDALGRHDAAFPEFSAGNRIAFEAAPPEGRPLDEIFGELSRVFQPDLFEHHAGSGSASERPIFIVGMPRSGTTLVEVALARHPDVAAGGELPFGPQLWGDYVRAHPDWAAKESPLPGEDLAGLAAGYLARLDEIDPDARFVTDKLPNNFLRIGILALMFPAARFVHCVRDPRDTCLSCFTTKFDVPRRHLTDLAELGRYYRFYRDTMALWERVLPGRIVTVRYEEFVRDPVAGAAGLFARLEIAPPPAGAASDPRPDHAIHTASVVQARQPVYTTSVARWKRYEKHLGPLIEALGEVADE